MQKPEDYGLLFWVLLWALRHTMLASGRKKIMALFSDSCIYICKTRVVEGKATATPFRKMICHFPVPDPFGDVIIHPRFAR